MLELNKIYNLDWVEGLKQLDDESIDVCMTSPPYYAMRDYFTDGQIGLEPTFKEYIEKLCNGFDEIKRVLKKSGSIWINMGDTYYGSGKGAGGNIENSKQTWTWTHKEKKSCKFCNKEFYGWKFQHFCSSKCSGVDNTPQIKKNPVMQSKNLMQIPARFAIEMCEHGWILRNDIIWVKSNSLPTSAKDRLIQKHEHVFHFTKSKRYYYNLDAIRKPYAESSEKRFGRDLTKHSSFNYRVRLATQDKEQAYMIKASDTEKLNYNERDYGLKKQSDKGSNPGNIWIIPSAQNRDYEKLHFALYPVRLCEIPIKASLPNDGIILDPFAGTGTTFVAMYKYCPTANYIGFEINSKYIEMAERRIRDAKFEIKRKRVKIDKEQTKLSEVLSNV